MSKKDSGDGEMPAGADGSRIVAISRGVPPELMAIGSMSSVQLGAALAVPVMAAIGPATTTALRLFWSGILLALFVRPRFSRMTPYQWLAGASLGVVIATMTVCYFVAISRIPMGPATAIEFLGPLGVALIGARKLIHLVLAIVAGIGVFLLECRCARSRFCSCGRAGVGCLYPAHEKSRGRFSWTTRPVDRTTGRCCRRGPSQLCRQAQCSRVCTVDVYYRLGCAHSAAPVCARDDGAPEDEHAGVRDFHEHGARHLCHARLFDLDPATEPAANQRERLCCKRQRDYCGKKQRRVSSSERETQRARRSRRILSTSKTNRR
jgi:hypothetical protein